MEVKSHDELWHLVVTEYKFLQNIMVRTLEKVNINMKS